MDLCSNPPSNQFPGTGDGAFAVANSAICVRFFDGTIDSYSKVRQVVSGVTTTVWQNDTGDELPSMIGDDTKPALPDGAEIIPCDKIVYPIGGATPITPPATVANCNGDVVAHVQDTCANDKLAAMVVLLTNLGANTDQIEALQQANTSAVNSLTQYIDQVESLLGVLGGNTDSLESLLTQLVLNTDTLEAGQVAIQGSVDAVKTSVDGAKVAIDAVKTSVDLGTAATNNVKAAVDAVKVSVDSLIITTDSVKTAVDLGTAAVVSSGLNTVAKLDEILLELQAVEPPVDTTIKRVSGTTDFIAGYKALYITCYSGDCEIQGAAQDAGFSLNLEFIPQGYATAVNVTGTDYTYTETR